MSMQPHPKPLRDAKIMLVDDDALMTDYLRTCLDDAGYRNVFAVNDPNEALARVAAERPDVLVLDLVMPQRSGFDLLAALRAEADLDNLVVLVLTAAAEQANIERAVALGASEVMTKPVMPEQLLPRLEHHLRQSGFSGA